RGRLILRKSSFDPRDRPGHVERRDDADRTSRMPFDRNDVRDLVLDHQLDRTVERVRGRNRQNRRGRHLLRRHLVESASRTARTRSASATTPQGFPPGSSSSPCACTTIAWTRYVAIILATVRKEVSGGQEIIPGCIASMTRR